MKHIQKLKVTVQHGLDFIGDIHACYDEFLELLHLIGYTPNKDGLYTHPDGRKIVSLGDVMSRGPKSIDTMLFFLNHVQAGHAYMIDSNHGWKIARWLDMRNVQLRHGDEKVEEEFKEYERKNGEVATKKLKEELRDFLLHARSHLIFNYKDEQDVVAVHAGIKDEYIGRENNQIQNFCRYGDVNGFDEKGKPIRREWFLSHQPKELIIWGHDPKPEPLEINNTINIDQGVVFGGKLTSFRYPERELKHVNAKKDYAGVADNPIKKS